MTRILTGVQSTATPHLGNILGAILPAIQMSNGNAEDSFLFIADLLIRQWVSPLAATCGECVTTRA